MRSVPFIIRRPFFMRFRFSLSQLVSCAAPIVGMAWATPVALAQFSYWDNGGATAIQNVWRNSSVPAGNAATNWVGNTAPATGASVVLADSFVSQNQTIDIQGEDKRIGSLYVGGRYNYTVNSTAGKKIIFDAPSGGSYLLDTNSGSGATMINAGVQLANDLTVYNYDNQSLRFGGLVETPSSTTLTVTGPGNTIFAGGITGGGIFAKSDSGVLEFDSTISLGTLNLSGGTLLLSNAMVGVTTLHVTGNSILDFGTGLGSILTATNVVIDQGAILTIAHWTNATDYFYAQSTPGSANLSRVAFTGFGAATWQSFDKQVRPVPEAGCYGAIFLALAASTVLFRRRATSHDSQNLRCQRE